MTTSDSRDAAAQELTGQAPGGRRSRPAKRWLTAAAWAVALALLGLAAANFSRGADAARIANPAVHGAPRPVHYLFGWTHWLELNEIGTVLMVVQVVAVVVLAWRRYPRHPILLMVFAATTIVWMDPIMNWAPYAVYNPQLWHWPVNWPLASLSPTVEPFIVIGYATFYVSPFFPAIWILRKAQARQAPGSFAWRHPLTCLAVLIYLIGFVFDACLEILCIRGGLYIYSQVIPFGSVFTGTPFQFPLLWESSLVTIVMIPAGLLLYRDDTGRTQAEKLTQRVRVFRGRPALGTFTVMFAILMVAYCGYGGAFAIIRDARLATSVACPWPYPEAKVYDPQGFYEKAGQPGPYSAGIWDGWESAQAGRPAVSPPAAGGGRCAPGAVNG
jgi:hypothetical protein